MTKRGYLIIAVLFSFIVILVVLLAFVQSAQTKQFSEVVHVDPSKITEVALNSPDLNTRFRSTTDPQEVNKLVHYLEKSNYQRLNNDQSAYMPTRAGMIYLYEGDKVDFLIPYEKEVMINHKVYRVKNQPIDNQFLQDFYLSLEE